MQVLFDTCLRWCVEQDAGDPAGGDNLHIVDEPAFVGDGAIGLELEFDRDQLAAIRIQVDALTDKATGEAGLFEDLDAFTVGRVDVDPTKIES